MNFRKKIVFSFTITLIALFSGALGWVFQFIVISVIYLHLGYFIKNNTSKNKVLFFLIFTIPFTLIYGIVLISQKSINLKVIPIFLAPIVFYLTGYFFQKKTKKELGAISLLIIILGFFFIINWINFVSHKTITNIDKFPEISIVNENLEKFNFNSRKIKIIDVWSSSCSICIKKFPEFENLKIRYENNTNIEFFSLNLPLKKDSLINIKNYTKNYSFKKLYATELDSWEQLNIKGVPIFLVLDKKNNLVYKGSLNASWYDLYNNIHKIIKSIDDK